MDRYRKSGGFGTPTFSQGYTGLHREFWRGKDGIVNLKQRALAGVLGGFSATLVLSGLREAFTRVGLVFETAPMQVVDRVEELGLVGDPSPGGRSLLTVVAHFAYGMGAGTAFGFLRRKRGGPTEEAAVGAALGLLVWGVGQLAATGRCQPSALDQAHAQGPAARVGPRGVRGGVGAGELGGRWAREGRLDKGDPKGGGIPPG